MPKNQRRVNDDPMKRVVIPVVSRDNVELSGSSRQQGRGISAVPPRLDARAEIIQHLLSLPLAGVNDGQNALDEAAQREMAAVLTAELPSATVVAIGRPRVFAGFFQRVLHVEDETASAETPT